MSKLAIVHTTPVTVEPLKKLVAEVIPECQVINFVDDSILPQLISSDGDLSLVEERLNSYISYGFEVGADLVLSACSSVGEVFDEAQNKHSNPVLRIDEAMAEKAVREGTKIGIAATLGTTLKPTLNLLKRKAIEAGKEVEFTTELVNEAYERLVAGDQEGHDTLLKERLSQLVAETDVVVLAQASMARVIEKLGNDLRKKFLTSPRLGIERVKKVLERD